MVTVISLLCWGFYFMGTKIDISGMVFNRLTVIKQSDKRIGKEIMWECVCECGGFKTTRAADLKNGKTKSCGCLNSEVLIKRNTKHGFSKTRIYEIWQGMIKRCTNPKSEFYHIYGGRGIKVCKRWMVFINFYNDTKSTYKDDLSIDRFPNTNGDYEPNNFRWATEEQQANNKTTNVLLTYNNKTLTISQWAKEVGIHQGVIGARLIRGWDIERALTFPIQKAGGNRRTIKGKHIWELK